MRTPSHARVHTRLFVSFIGAAAVALFGATRGESQIISGPTAPSWAGTFTSGSGGGLLTVGSSILTPDPAGTQEELPGLGHKFELFGAMQDDTDPQNATGGSGAQGGGVGGNETISATM